MAYIPHDWSDNESIASERLNHIETGIAEVSQNIGKSGAIFLSTSNYASYSHYLGFFAYVKFTSDGYEFVTNVSWADAHTLFWLSNTQDSLYGVLPVTLGDAYLVWAAPSDDWESHTVVVSGEISSDRILIHYPLNSAEYQGYIISGVANVSLISH